MLATSRYPPAPRTNKRYSLVPLSHSHSLSPHSHPHPSLPSIEPSSSSPLSFASPSSTTSKFLLSLSPLHSSSKCSSAPRIFSHSSSPRAGIGAPLTFEESDLQAKLSRARKKVKVEPRMDEFKRTKREEEMKENEEIQSMLSEIVTNKAKREEKRAVAFSVDKFLCSRQHLSTETERLQAAEILKKDARHRSTLEFEQLAKFLQTAPFFSQCSLAVCLDIARIAKLRKFKREEIIYREGDDATCLCILLTGSVGTRINARITQKPINMPQQKLYKDDEEEYAGDSYIAGVEYAGASFGSESFSSSLLPRHSSTRMAIERTEVLIVETNEYDIIMRDKRKQEEKEKMLLLKDIKVMELCTDEELWRLAQIMQTLRVSKNEVIIEQGQISDRFYFVQSGECRIIYQAKETKSLNTHALTEPFFLDVGRLGVGTFVGELGLFQNSTSQQVPRRTATVYAETSCILFAVTYEDFLARAPRFVLSAMQEFGDTVYIKQQSQLEKMVQQEKKWRAWKFSLFRSLKPRGNRTAFQCR